MSLSKSGFLYFALLFYGLTIILLGVIPINSTIEDKLVTDNDKFGFSDRLILNIQELPEIFNFIFFGSLASIVVYVIITTILGALFDGGS